MAEAKDRFMGTYFDRDDIVRTARIVLILSWVVAGIYAFDLLLGLAVFGLQAARGFMGGLGITDIAQQVLFIVERALHGILYFAVLQGVSKALLIFLDLEDNTRRAARKQ